MKEYKRVLKFITDNRQDIDHSSNEHLALQLYKFFYGVDCATCKNEALSWEKKPCSICKGCQDGYSEWSPK